MHHVVSIVMLSLTVPFFFNNISNTRYGFQKQTLKKYAYFKNPKGNKSNSYPVVVTVGNRLYLDFLLDLLIFVVPCYLVPITLHDPRVLHIFLPQDCICKHRSGLDCDFGPRRESFP